MLKKLLKELKSVKHDKIKLVLNDYNTSILKNKKKIIKENSKRCKKCKKKTSCR